MGAVHCAESGGFSGAVPGQRQRPRTHDHDPAGGAPPGGVAPLYGQLRASGVVVSRRTAECDPARDVPGWGGDLSAGARNPAASRVPAGADLDGADGGLPYGTGRPEDTFLSDLPDAPVLHAAGGGGSMDVDEAPALKMGAECRDVPVCR